MQSTPLVCLLGGPKPGKGRVGLQRRLQKAGFSPFSLVVPDPKVLTPEWVNKNLPVSTYAIVLVNAPVLWVKSVLEGLRGASSTRSIPVLYGYARSKDISAQWKGAAPFGLGDFFELDEAPAMLHLRISARASEARAQGSLFAKVDTALKQREEFLSVCAHDLRSPLGLIQTCLTMLLKGQHGGMPFAPAVLELLNRAQRQSAQALSLVKDLLDVTALDQGLKPQYQMHRLHDILEEFFLDYSVQAQQKNIHFRYNNPVPEWRVLADSERIKQLLQNLFSNALKFTEPGKNIYLNVAPFQGRRKNDPSHPMIVVSLKDEGKGMPQSEMQKIFDRFVQIKEHSREGGRGLGLSVAKQISTLHDGNIWVESELGRGSTFFVLFPHTISRMEWPYKRESPKRILIAEPSSEKRKATFERLEKWGYQLEFAKDGVDAVTHCFHSWPDAVVLTPELSKLSTPEVANLLKGDPHASRIPLVLISPQGPTASRKIERVLADAVLPLDFTKEEWERALGVGGSVVALRRTA